MPELPIMQGNYPEDIAQLMAKELERVWQEKGMPKSLNLEITQAYANVFTEALQQGYGVNLSEIDYNTPDGVMLDKLKNNIYQFSAAKNYTQLQQLSKALLDENGKIRSFTDFKKEAFEITQQHNIKWLKAEYDLAINSAQMARKWVEIQAQKNKLPLLQFDATIDSRTSPYCKGFDGVIKPVDDAFWDVYYPPNHYNCRSIVRQLNQGIVTANETIVYPDKPIPKLFQTNLAKTGLLFPPNHPYYIRDSDNNKIQTLPNYINDPLEYAKIKFTGATDDELKSIGLTRKELIEMAGGIPTSRIKENEVHIYFLHEKAVRIIIDNSYYYTDRTFDFENMIAKFNYLKVYDKGKGLGLAIFTNSIVKLRNLGFKKIKVQAAKSEEFNGYYTWARLGYSFDGIDYVKRFKEFKELYKIKAANLQKLMMKEEWAELWLRNGFEFYGKFDLENENSINLKHLRKYLKLKKIKVDF